MKEMENDMTRSDRPDTRFGFAPLHAPRKFERRGFALPSLVLWLVACGPPEAAVDEPPPPPTATAQPTAEAVATAHADYLAANYDKSEYMVAMRDGIELYTLVYEPRDRSREYPILLFRTPYSVGPYEPGEYRNPLGPSREFDLSGYIFAFQDVRGQFRSEGEFEVIRAPAPEPRGRTDTDEITDNRDTIEWLLANVDNHNGRVGQWGISYPGWQTVMGMVDAHPALVAASPQASPSDMFIGDDWHHNGAFRIMYAFSWLSGNARRRDGPTETRGARFDYGTTSGYDFFLNAGSAATVDELYFHGDVPAWRDFIEHPNYDEFWQRQNALRYLDDVRPATLNVAGWFDTEDFYGPMSIYRTIEAENPGLENTLVVGPWLHGGWRRMDGDFLGCIAFDSRTSLHFQREFQYPFFEYHLKAEGTWDATEAHVFLTGTNEWRAYDAWPPAGVAPVSLYLGPDGTLSFEPPTRTGDSAASAVDSAAESAADSQADTYVSDPASPVPFSAEERTTLGHLWKVEDQRFASGRPDVLVYQSEPLEEDLTIAGPIGAEIFVSTTGTDSDWIVKLIDVYPDDAPPSANCDVPMGGYQMHLAGEIMRGRFRNDLENPEPMAPGEVTRIEIDLRDRFHTFKAGHRLMVHVQSSWFPAYDRNPQTFVDTYTASPGDYRAATQTVYRSADYPSRVILGVLPR
ncbi:MAG: CocE/NonD family hydrolase [Gemmatimonadales bacterium]|nr:CocE/NonD family hydrolase [Gemmatimonadales bacterium]MYK02761.1 CocE/NonD family hydrolase [Candidatus Palauibacter ramosifaciens]